MPAANARMNEFNVVCQLRPGLKTPGLFLPEEIR